MGGRSRAAIGLTKLMRLWVPSQKGAFADWPQRQRVTAVRPPRPKVLPVWSTISKSPSMRMEPLLKTVTLVLATNALRDVDQRCEYTIAGEAEIVNGRKA